jgi:hypothetical protein
LIAAGAAWVYSRTQSGQSVVPDIVGGIVSTIRGIRNNNPTNMVDAGIQWDGLTGVDANGFLVFGTMEQGLTAASKNLKNYALLHGIDTVDGAIRRWSATDQDAYVSNVAAYLGVDPQDSIDLTDPGTRANLLRGIIRQEDGGAGALLVSDALIVQAANV